LVECHDAARALSCHRVPHLALQLRRKHLRNGEARARKCKATGARTMTRADKVQLTLALLDELGLSERQLDRVKRMIESVSPYDQAVAGGEVKTEETKS
jgi:hypothetical protein